MRFLTRAELEERIAGRSLAIVGSGPGVLDNPPGRIDGHDLVVRVNNYKLVPPATGVRTDVYYSFFGSSIRKHPEELARDGVRLCLAKCPNARPLQSAWHEQRGRWSGVDFRYIYELRRGWWFCDTYVPDVEEFLTVFRLLNEHVPTTGFSALWTLLQLRPRAVYLTGFDFFRSGIHNVNEPHRVKNLDDPIRHAPELEAAWLRRALPGLSVPVTLDAALERALAPGSVGVSAATSTAASPAVSSSQRASHDARAGPLNLRWR